MRTSLVLASLLIVACGGGASSPDAQVHVDAGADAAPSCSDPALPVFLERGGGSFRAGPEDPATNHSSMVQGTTALTGYTVDDAAWNEIVACVADHLAPFHLRVTDVDPGAVDQLEIVFTDATANTLGYPSGLRALSPFACGGLRDSVHFVLPTEVGASQPPRDLCLLAVQAVGHAAGLEFTTDCSDLMAADIIDLAQCTGAGGFTDADLPCGTVAPTTCMCGTNLTTQNSAAKMTAAFGACP